MGAKALCRRDPVFRQPRGHIKALGGTGKLLFQADGLPGGPGGGPWIARSLTPDHALWPRQDRAVSVAPVRGRRSDPPPDVPRDE